MNKARSPAVPTAGPQNHALTPLFSSSGSFGFSSFVMSVLCGVFLALPAQVAAAEDTSPGRYLAANCANCHGTQGQSKADKGIALAGLKADYIVSQMQAFRDGKRPATVMHQIARGYSEEQIRTLASYFAQQVRK